MIDLGYQPILGITSVILIALEENRIEWMDSDDINFIRKQHILNSVSAYSQCSAAGQPIKRKQYSSATHCSTYNLGKCNLPNNPMSNGVMGITCNTSHVNISAASHTFGYLIPVWFHTQYSA